jgi:DNA-binding HxlR family transcriptional regulator
VCSVADTLALFGDRYSLAIVRELFYGNHRFVDLVEYVAAPRSVLASRLSTLLDAGVVLRRQYSERPPRDEYLLTEAGRALAPVLLALKQWGDRWCRDGQQTAVFAHSCGDELDAVTVCRVCREPVHFVELEVVGGSNPPTITPADSDIGRSTAE